MSDCLPIDQAILYFQVNPWDNFIPELLIGIISSLLGFLGAFLLLRKQIKNERKREKLSEQKTLDDYYNYLEFSILRILKPAEVQCKEFQKLISQLSLSETNDLHLEAPAAFNFRWFENLDKVKLYNCFFKNFSGTLEDKSYYYNQMLAHIDYMDIVSKEFISEFRKIMDEANKYQELFNNAKAPIINLNDQIAIHLQQVNLHKEKLSSFEREMIEVTRDWYLIEEPRRHDMFITYEKYISKLPAILKEYPNPQLIIYLNSIRDCNFAYRSYKKNQAYAITIFSGYFEGLNKSIKRLKVIVKKMKTEPVT